MYLAHDGPKSQVCDHFTDPNVYRIGKINECVQTIEWNSRTYFIIFAYARTLQDQIMRR